VGGSCASSGYADLEGGYALFLGAVLSPFVYVTRACVRLECATPLRALKERACHASGLANSLISLIKIKIYVKKKKKKNNFF
jgi:hypothetical protein